MSFACKKLAANQEWSPPPRAATPTPAVIRRPGPVLVAAKPNLAAAKAKPLPAPCQATSTPEPDAVLLRARALADAGEVAAAADLLANAPHAAMAHADFFALRGIVHESLGDHVQAEADLRKAVYLDPSHAEALSHLSLLLELQGRTDAAATLRRRARQHTPSAS